MDEMEQEQAENTAAEETATVSSEDGGTQEKSKKKKVSYPFWKRLLIFLLGTTIGFVSCLGAIVGAGFWIYSNVSLNKLEEMGIAVPLPEALQGKGEVDITEYTLKALVGDILYYTDESHKGELSISTLKERYGFKVLSDVEEFLPEKLIDLPFSDLGEDGVLNTILSALDLSTILNFIPEGTLSEPMIDALKDVDFSSIGEGGVGVLLAKVKLGYLLGATYEKQGDEWVLIPADPNQKSLLDYFSDIYVGDLLSDDGSVDILGILKDNLSDVPLVDLLGIPSDSASMFAGICFGDLILKDEATGTYYMDFASALNDMTSRSTASLRI